MAFSVTPEMLKLDISKNDTVVFGVIMDLPLDSATITVVAFKTGDASIYMSTGQGFIGGSAHASVVQAARAFTSQAQLYLAKSMSASDFSLPNSVSAKFHLLTNKGHYMHQEAMSDLEDQRSDWSPLFYAGNDIITQYRAVTETN